MAKRIVVLLLSVAVVCGWAAPASARHNDKHCTGTVHYPLGTDELVKGFWPEDVPSDLGLVKIFVNCDRDNNGNNGNNGKNDR